MNVKISKWTEQDENEKCAKDKDEQKKYQNENV